MNNTRYPTAYGKWAGSPKGNAPKYDRCCEEVRSSDGWHRHQCSRKRGHGPDQAYCKTHDPVAVAARAKAATDAYHEKFNKARYGYHGRTFYAALKQIAEGHNDARGLAQEIIATFHEGEHK